MWNVLVYTVMILTGHPDVSFLYSIEMDTHLDVFTIVRWGKDMLGSVQV